VLRDRNSRVLWGAGFARDPGLNRAVLDVSDLADRPFDVEVVQPGVELVSAQGSILRAPAAPVAPVPPG
jgi:hypothetical protein